MTVFRGEPDIKGRYFYNTDGTGLNFTSYQAPLHTVLDNIEASAINPAAPSYYMGSTVMDAFFPGLTQANTLALESDNPMVSIWMGNRSRIACHYDEPENIACCVAGLRRFTLFPPQQIHNLYPGPIDFTPAGQAISLVDFEHIDFQTYPRFKHAIAHAQIAELEPGDGIFIPALWWHQVESLSPFNVLINYWWRRSPQFMGAGADALKHALMNIRDLPSSERAAWQEIFNYYIFNDTTRPREHIDPQNHGALGPINDTTSRRIRAILMNQLKC